MNILFAVSELEGVIKTGGLADVARALPQALNVLKQDARIALPYYQAVRNELPISSATKSYAFTLNLAKEYQVKVHLFEVDNTYVYCFDIDELFNRSGIYGDNYQAYPDNGERYSVFCLAILYFYQYFASQINFKPQVFHCNDWHTGLLPFYHAQDDFWQSQDSNTVLSIHNGAFQGIFDLSSVPSLLFKAGEDHSEYERDLVNFLKLGINNASKIVAVSPNYANELLTELGSHHLFDVFNQNQDKVIGILNGCDYKDWDPETDPLIKHHFSSSNLTGKTANKKHLQKNSNMPVDEKVPVFSQVARLTDQKGMNYLLPAIKELIQHNIQIYIAGTGDPVYVDQLEFLSKKYPDKMHFYHGYSEEIAHQYMASSDFFLMPSLFEPCGLTQMYALAYGTLPVVREVGGLKDTVVDLGKTDATGVVFKNPKCEDLVSAIRRGILYYLEYPDKFASTQKQAMQSKFLWQSSAQKYLISYENI